MTDMMCAQCNCCKHNHYHGCDQGHKRPVYTKDDICTCYEGGHVASRSYYEKRIAEGMTKRQALKATRKWLEED